MTPAEPDRAALLPDDVVAAVRTVLQQVLRDEPEARAFVFGSRVSGTGTPRSDFDIGVDAGHPLDPRVLVELRESLDELPVLLTFDVVDFACVTPRFREAALEDAEVLLG